MKHINIYFFAALMVLTSNFMFAQSSVKTNDGASDRKAPKIKIVTPKYEKVFSTDNDLFYIINNNK